MGKTDLTKRIEYEVFNYFHVKRSIRCALEVQVHGGRVDIMAMKDDTVYCIEIKVSLSDFKSKNGHNFVGHLNYYAVPFELVDKIVDLVPKNIGILAIKKHDYSHYKDDLIFYSVESIQRASRLKIEDRYIEYYRKNMYVAMASNIHNLLKNRLNGELKWLNAITSWS